MKQLKSHLSDDMITSEQVGTLFILAWEMLWEVIKQPWAIGMCITGLMKGSTGNVRKPNDSFIHYYLEDITGKGCEDASLTRFHSPGNPVCGLCLL